MENINCDSAVSRHLHKGLKSFVNQFTIMSKISIGSYILSKNLFNFTFKIELKTPIFLICQKFSKGNSLTFTLKKSPNLRFKDKFKIRHFKDNFFTKDLSLARWKVNIETEGLFHVKSSPKVSLIYTLLHFYIFGCISFQCHWTFLFFSV